MNGVLWTWVLDKAWTIDTKVLKKKGFDRQWCETEQGANEVISGVGRNGKTEKIV